MVTKIFCSMASLYDVIHFLKENVYGGAKAESCAGMKSSGLESRGGAKSHQGRVGDLAGRKGSDCQGESESLQVRRQNERRGEMDGPKGGSGGWEWRHEQREGRTAG